LFEALQPDPQGTLDAVLDKDNMPLDKEPSTVVADLEAVRQRWSSGQGQAGLAEDSANG
jgi:hypothetical protein